MIAYQEAIDCIHNNRLDLGSEIIELADATLRVLAEDLFADRDLPPYDRVTMDGIAVAYSSFQTGRRKFKIENISPAGSPQKTLNDSEGCIEVMTGTSLPKGCDTVIRYEDIEIVDNVAHLTTDAIKPSQNVHHKGSDILQQSLLVRQGTVLSPAEISIAASIGKHQLQVRKLPKTAIITTGDELVDIDKSPLAHQIRKSNGASISSMLMTYGIASDAFHLKDTKEHITTELQSIIGSYDLIILSGGVSKGKFDFIPSVLKELGVNKIFHKVKQRPGKPLWFGRKDDCVIFGLPGNPVSSYVGSRKYIFEWLNKSLEINNTKDLYALLESDYKFSPDLHLFLPVKIKCNNNGQLIATPLPGNGSGDFINLTHADGFMELPVGKELFSKGEVYPVILYR